MRLLSEIEQLKGLRQGISGRGGLIGASRSMRKVYAQIDMAAACDLPVRTADCEGNRIVARDAILRLAAVPMDKKIMEVDLGIIRSRVMQNPYFKDASVVRDLPDRVLVRVEPAAVPAGGAAAPATGPRLVVDDSGPGIPPEDRERVFDRFYRRNPGGSEGTGLGLAIVKTVAERHGAQVLLSDSPLGGLRATVSFPA